MSRTRWMKVLRDMAQHKVRTMMIVVAIAIGLLAAGTILDTNSIIKVATEAEFLATNPFSAMFRVDDIDQDLLEGIRDLPAVADAQARRQNGGMALVDGQWKRMQLFVLDEYGDPRIGKLQPVAGAWPPRDGQIVIEQSSLDFAQVGVGDELRLGIVHGVSEFLPVTGVVRDSGLAPGWMENLVYGFVTRGTIEMLGGVPNLDQIQIVVARDRMDVEHVRSVASDVKAYIESKGRTVSEVRIPEPGKHIHAGQMDSLMFVQFAMGALALALSGLLILNHMSALLAGQVREIGVMKAIGAGSGQIASLYLAQAVLMGLAASALALPPALMIAQRYATFIGGLLNFDVAGYAPRPSIIWAQLAVGILLPILASIMPVWRGTRLTVNRALRDQGITEGAFGQRAFDRYLSRIGGQTRPLLLSLRNAFRRRGRLILTLLALSTGGAVFLGTLNLRATIRRSVDDMFSRFHYDLAVLTDKSLPYAEFEALVGSVPGVLAAEVTTGTNATLVLAEGKESNPFAMSGLPIDFDMIDNRLLEGRWLEPGDTDAIVINNTLRAREAGLQLGARITIKITGTLQEWTVVGVMDTATASAIAYVERDALALALGTPGRGNRVILDLAATDLAAQRESSLAVQQALAGSGYAVDVTQLIKEARVVREDHLLMVSSFLLIMSLLTIVVGGLGLATTMSLAVLERTREIGILKAIGAAHGTIRRLVLVEGLCIGLISCVIAVPMSVPMSVLVGNAFGRIMFQSPLNFVTAPDAIVTWFAIALGLSVLASLYPAICATRRTTVAALAYE